MKLARRPGTSRAQVAKGLGLHANILGRRTGQFSSGKWDPAKAKPWFSSIAKRARNLP